MNPNGLTYWHEFQLFVAAFSSFELLYKSARQRLEKTDTSDDNDDDDDVAAVR